MDPNTVLTVLTHPLFRHVERHPNGNYLLTYWEQDRVQAKDLSGTFEEVISAAHAALTA